VCPIITRVVDGSAVCLAVDGSLIWVLSVQAGYLMDRHNRVHLLIGCVVLGEAPCLATLFVTRFWQLLLTRLLTGIAVGGVHFCNLRDSATRIA
jgi:MFS family permease